MATLVLTVIGDDRAGLVDALAGPIADHGGNWDRSTMARLAGKFAGIVVVTLPDDAGRFARGPALPAFRHRVSSTCESPLRPPTGRSTTTPLLALHLIGQDRPGIIREVASALAQRDVSIEELETSTISAPMSAERLFEATASLRLPADVDLDALQLALEDIANELMVDLDVTTPIAAEPITPPERG